MGILLNLLEAAVLGRDAETAAAISRRFEGMAGEISDAYEPIAIARLLAGAAALLGDTDKARAYYEQALEVAGKIRCRPEIALTQLGLAELLLDEANSGQPSAISTPPPRGKRGGQTADKLTADSARAEALAHLDLAIGEFRDMKMRPALERALRHKEVLRA